MWQSFDVIFCRICTSSAVCCFRAPSVDIFDIFAASGESNAWVLLWKTRLRPIGVRICSVAQFNFLSTTRVSGHWLCSGRKIRDVRLHPKTKEETRPALHHRQDLTSLMILIFLLVDILNLLRYLPRWPPSLWPPAPPPAGEGERVRTGNSSRERSRPRSTLPEPQLTRIPMAGGDDGRPPQDGRQRQRSRSRDRVHLMHKRHRNHKFNLWAFRSLLMNRMRISLITINRTIAVS